MGGIGAQWRARQRQQQSQQEPRLPQSGQCAG